MHSYQIELEHHQDYKTLRVGFSRVKPASGDRIVKDALERVEQMYSAGELEPGGILKIDGPQSVPVAYVLAHKLGHLYEAIAVLDPKIGKKGYKTYIVVITHGSPRYQIGDLIETQEPQPEQRSKVKVVLCGPPRSGKSCLRDALKKAILEILGAPYPYVITACPDGEGSWHNSASENDKDSTNLLKQSNKGEFTPDFAQEATKWVKSANQLINIIDVGGKITPENRMIIKEATHAVILSNDCQQFKEWQELCLELGLKIIAKIESSLEDKEDEVIIEPSWKENTDELLQQNVLLTGKIYGLSRNKTVVVPGKMVKQLAEIINHLTQS